MAKLAPIKKQKRKKRTKKMGLSGALGKRFVFQIESQTGKPLRKNKQKTNLSPH